MVSHTHPDLDIPFSDFLMISSKLLLSPLYIYNDCSLNPNYNDNIIDNNNSNNNYKDTTDNYRKFSGAKIHNAHHFRQLKWEVSL